LDWITGKGEYSSLVGRFHLLMLYPLSQFHCTPSIYPQLGRREATVQRRPDGGRQRWADVVAGSSVRRRNRGGDEHLASNNGDGRRRAPRSLGGRSPRRGWPVGLTSPPPRFPVHGLISPPVPPLVTRPFLALPAQFSSQAEELRAVSMSSTPTHWISEAG